MCERFDQHEQGVSRVRTRTEYYLSAAIDMPRLTTRIRAWTVPRSRSMSARELLVPNDGEQLELAVALCAGASGQNHQCLGAVLGEQDLAVDIDAAEFGMEDDLAVVVAVGDLLKFPHADE